jgi:hypothetical protein
MNMQKKILTALMIALGVFQIQGMNNVENKITADSAQCEETGLVNCLDVNQMAMQNKQERKQAYDKIYSKAWGSAAKKLLDKANQDYKAALKTILDSLEISRQRWNNRYNEIEINANEIPLKPIEDEAFLKEVRALLNSIGMDASRIALIEGERFLAANSHMAAIYMNPNCISDYFDTKKGLKPEFAAGLLHEAAHILHNDTTDELYLKSFALLSKKSIAKKDLLRLKRCREIRADTFAACIDPQYAKAFSVYFYKNIAYLSNELYGLVAYQEHETPLTRARRLDRYHREMVPSAEPLSINYSRVAANEALYALKNVGAPIRSIGLPRQRLLSFDPCSETSLHVSGQGKTTIYIKNKYRWSWFHPKTAIPAAFVLSQAYGAYKVYKIYQELHKEGKTNHSTDHGLKAVECGSPR